MCEQGLSQWEALALIRQSFVHAFLPSAEREALLKSADQATFRAAVHALRGLRGIPCRFEVVTGDPTPTLLELTRGAAALIVGSDEGTGRTIARRCVAHAECPVVTVPTSAA